MDKKFIIIGGDAAGLSAASKARREDPDLQITVLEKSGWASYGACGLPYYIMGDVKKLEDLVAIPPEEFRKKRNIDLRLNHEVKKIDPVKKSLTVKTTDGDITISYDKLLISTGAKALKPRIDGINETGVFTLHSMDSAEKIKDYLKSQLPKSVMIIGGGYIGMEMAEAFYAIKMNVSIVELLPHLLNNFGAEIAEVIEEHVKDKAGLYLKNSVQSIKKTAKGKLSVHVAGQEGNSEIETDLVLVATGIVPEVSLAKECGIRLGSTGAIANDQYGQTNYPDIYTAGDCAEAQHIVTGEPVYIPLALTANRNGRAIGRTIGGRKTVLTPIAGTAVVKVFQMEVATTGITDPAIAKKHGFDPVRIMIDSYSRAGYYPGSKSIKIVLMADRKSKRLLGASMAGEEGISKRIDIIATSLSGRFTVEQLENLDLAYAPPFSPVWDPVLMAARVLNGKLIS